MKETRCARCNHSLAYHAEGGCGYVPVGLGRCLCDARLRTPEVVTPEVAKPDLKQVGGDHYLRAIQIWDIVEVWELGYFRGSVLKYLLRAGNKGSKVEDLKKARHFLDRAIEIAEREGM